MRKYFRDIIILIECHCDESNALVSYLFYLLISNPFHLIYLSSHPIPRHPHLWLACLNNDQQALNENPLLPEEIQDLQTSDPIVPVGHPIETHRHYTTYFYQQIDFNDYEKSNMLPRMPKLFTGKRYIS